MTDGEQDRLRSVFRRYVRDEAELDAVFRGVPILTAISIDSLAMVYLITEIENEFSVRFDYASIERVFHDLTSLTAFVTGGSGTR